MELDEALEHALRGQAILFTGAGFSTGATNLRDHAFLGGRGLAEHLSLLAGLPDVTTLDDAAEEYAERFGEDALIEEMKVQYTAREILPEHVRLTSIPWRRVYTTNYDDVIEQGYTRNGVGLASVTLDDHVQHISKKSTICIHFNGAIRTLTRERLRNGFLLTDTSYVTARVIDSPWSNLFRADIASSRAVFFVGYSLSDLDIKRLLFAQAEHVDRCFFIVGPNADSATLRRAGKFGHVLSLTTAELGQAFQEKALHYEPSRETEPIPFCLRKLEVPAAPVIVSDRQVFDLLIQGRIDQAALWGSLHGGPPYFLQRSSSDQVMSHLAKGQPAIVHGELANGKSAFLEGVKYRALEAGFDVYSVVNRSQDLAREIEYVLKADSRTLIVIDDYSKWLDAIEMFARSASRNTPILLAARSAINDGMIDKVSGMLQGRDLAEFSVDPLTDADLKWIVTFLDNYGLWGEMSSWSSDRKERFLAGNCRGQFHGILVKILESPQVAERFSSILDELNSQRSYYEVLTTILALAVLQYDTKIDTLIDIWGERVLSAQFQRNPAIRQVIDIDGGTIRLRSSAAAQFILKQVANPEVTVGALISLAIATHKARETPDGYGHLFSLLMRFKLVQNLVPEVGKKAALIRYYEGIKHLEACRHSPLFWLQYAIACLVLNELERAKKYFEAAYSYARARTFQTFQIDNHYARYLLVAAIADNQPESCMVPFRTAARLIHGQLSEKERFYYPYRVASAFWDFWQAFAPRLSMKDRDEIVRASRLISDRIEELPPARQQNRDVEACWDALRRLIVDASQRHTP